MRKKKTVITKPHARKLLFAVGVAVLFSSALATDQDRKKHYGLIFGTAYGPDDRPLYGVKVEIHPVGKKRPNWELVSDHRGEFAQRVPPGPSDYLVHGEAEVAPVVDGQPQSAKRKHFKAETKVHIESEERKDLSLHLTE